MSTKRQEKIINFIVKTKAIPKARPRFSRGRVYTPKSTCDFENIIRINAMAALGQSGALSGALVADLKFYFAGKKKDIGCPKTTRGDL